LAGRKLVQSAESSINTICLLWTEQEGGEIATLPQLFSAQRILRVHCQILIIEAVVLKAKLQPEYQEDKYWALGGKFAHATLHLCI